MDYIVTVTFTVRPDTDEHLQHEQAIRDEITSWLESLHATVQTVDVRENTPLTITLTGKDLKRLRSKEKK